MYDDVNRVTEKIEASRVRSKEADVKFSLILADTKLLSFQIGDIEEYTNGH